MYGLKSPELKTLPDDFVLPEVFSQKLVAQVRATKFSAAQASIFDLDFDLISGEEDSAKQRSMVCDWAQFVSSAVVVRNLSDDHLKSGYRDVPREIGDYMLQHFEFEELGDLVRNHELITAFIDSRHKVSERTLAAIQSLLHRMRDHSADSGWWYESGMLVMRSRWSFEAFVNQLALAKTPLDRRRLEDIILMPEKD